MAPRPPDTLSVLIEKAMQSSLSTISTGPGYDKKYIYKWDGWFVVFAAGGGGGGSGLLEHELRVKDHLPLPSPLAQTAQDG